ncbi:MAG: aminopeptidase [Nitrososphaerales archaeon]|nr:aminopeptidase [Nitrososphaerales archaeon]
MDYNILSRQVLETSLGVRRGDKVWINSWDHTVGLANNLSSECRRRGCEATVTVQQESEWVSSIVAGPTRLLRELSPQQSALLGESDHYVFTLGPKHPVKWASIPERRRKFATIWFLEQNEFVKEWKSIATRRRVKMIGIEATLATKERARALGIDYRIYLETVFAGCIIDSHELGRRSKELASILGGRGVVRLTTPGGTDLRFDLDKRPVERSDGLVTEEDARKGRVVFLPAGATGTTVDEESAEGTIVYDNPIRMSNGTIEELTFQVRDGRVTKSAASRGLSVFKEYLSGEQGDGDRFAFFGFGLNPRLRLGCTQDDKVLGAVELNFGENQTRGGNNEGSRNFWGTVNGATVSVEGREIMRRGKLLV